MNKDTLRQVLVVLAVIAVIAINILAVTLPLNGLDTGEISDQFDIYFVPAGYVFSIWSVIYLGLIAYAIFQLLPAQRGDPRDLAHPLPRARSHRDERLAGGRGGDHAGEPGGDRDER